MEAAEKYERASHDPLDVVVMLALNIYEQGHATRLAPSPAAEINECREWFFSWVIPIAKWFLSWVISIAKWFLSWVIPLASDSFSEVIFFASESFREVFFCFYKIIPYRRVPFASDIYRDWFFSGVFALAMEFHLWVIASDSIRERFLPQSSYFREEIIIAKCFFSRGHSFCEEFISQSDSSSEMVPFTKGFLLRLISFAKWFLTGSVSFYEVVPFATWFLLQVLLFVSDSFR